MNKVLEDILVSEQYAWEYKRFKGYIDYAKKIVSAYLTFPKEGIKTISINFNLPSIIEKDSYFRDIIQRAIVLRNISQSRTQIIY